MNEQDRAPLGRGLATVRLTIAWQSASLLLGYPDEQLVGQLETIHRVSHHLPDGVGGPLRSTLVHLESISVTELQAEYVETFHDDPRHNLHLVPGPLTGQGRELGLPPATRTYLQSGFTVDRCERPDHLSAVLEYAATVDQQLGGQLLGEHSAALELLRSSLTEAGSGWAGAVTAVLGTLRPVRDDDPSDARPDVVG